MSKMHYFSNKFSKIAKRWELSTPSASLLFDTVDLKLHDLKIVVFQTDYGEIELLNISVMSSQLRHQNNVTKIFYFVPSQ